MAYGSIDALQKRLAEDVFHYASDQKKAAGRALGTLVEVVTFYTLRAWELTEHITIERRIAEFANPKIRHNVEFALHPIINSSTLWMRPTPKPLTAAKLRADLPFLNTNSIKSTQMISSTDVIRNATVLDENASVLVVGNVDIYEESECLISVSRLEAEPFAIFECKRVGVEEGQKKGPQTIEKAKQGAYVARTVSALQKIRSRNGNILGVLEDSDGTYITDEYQVLLQKIINNREMYIPNGFIFTVGVVSNHGNWFTSNDLNKELHVLAQSYDWLLFLTDQGLVKFIEDLIISPEARFEPARHAFLSSYTGKKGRNKFTKVTMEATADRVLRQYFSENLDEIESWFNVINPGNAAPSELRSNLLSLSLKSRLGGFTDDSGKK